MFPKDLIRTVQEDAAAWVGPVLSVYLNVDPSQDTNLNRGYLARFKTAVRKVEEGHSWHGKLEEFRRTTRLLETEIGDYTPDAKALMIFRTPEGKGSRHRFRVRMREAVLWAAGPALEPLAEALDEHERYGVALVDRGRARLFVAQLGEIEEIGDLAADDVSRSKTPGHDNRWSEPNFGRRADEHAKLHIRNVAKILAEADQRYEFDRILLAGGMEPRQQLEGELQKALQGKLAGSVALPLIATPQDVLQMIEQVHTNVERREEVELVDGMMTAAAKQGQAVVGLQQTIRALGEGRIRALVISGNYRPQWNQLQEDAPWLRAEGNGSDDLLERMLDHTSHCGGRIEMVWGLAAERLEAEAGGIGAMLRY